MVETQQYAGGMTQEELIALAERQKMRNIEGANFHPDAIRVVDLLIAQLTPLLEVSMLQVMITQPYLHPLIRTVILTG